jgi:anhydro-N-acetylmuramic acid kinase
MQHLKSFKKLKKILFLVISAGGPQSGLNGVYFSFESDNWEILSNASIPYPKIVEKFIEDVMVNQNITYKIDELAAMDYKLTNLILDCAKTTISHAHKSVKHPHCGAVIGCTIWNGIFEDIQEIKNWDFSLGDAQCIASALKIPVVYNFSRHGIIGGTKGELPVFPGNLKISKGKETISVYLNIGLISRLTIVDNQARNIVIDSDVGPGTCLINLAASEFNFQNGFDRDGSIAMQGKVNPKCLDSLLSYEWFSKTGPKQAFIKDFIDLYNTNSELTKLSIHDKIATITALTARSAFDFFKREYHHPLPIETVWISGGGAHNLALIEYLRAFFNPIKIKSIEEVGIPAPLYIPLSVGLTLCDYLQGRMGKIKRGINYEITGLGRWVFP